MPLIHCLLSCKDGLMTPIAIGNNSMEVLIGEEKGKCSSKLKK